MCPEGVGFCYNVGGQWRKVPVASNTHSPGNMLGKCHLQVGHLLLVTDLKWQCVHAEDRSWNNELNAVNLHKLYIFGTWACK